MLPPCSLEVVKDNHKGWSDESGKPLLCTLSYEKTSYRGGGESNVPRNPSHLVLAIPFKGNISQVYR